MSRGLSAGGEKLFSLVGKLAEQGLNASQISRSAKEMPDFQGKSLNLIHTTVHRYLKKHRSSKQVVEMRGFSIDSLLPPSSFASLSEAEKFIKWAREGGQYLPKLIQKFETKNDGLNTVPAQPEIDSLKVELEDMRSKWNEALREKQWLIAKVEALNRPPKIIPERHLAVINKPV